MTAELPIRNRAGDVVAYVLVDEADLHLIARWRWSLLRVPGRSGYAKRNAGADGMVLMHRQLLGLTKGDGLGVDHRNGHGLDNRRCNLRIASQAENAQNLRAKGLSRHRGVSWRGDTRKWTARVTIGGVTTRLGCFDDEEVAAEVAASFRRQHMPFSQEAAT